ncbi:MAG: hypothetical protein WA949_12900 [Phormidesmis sp.]
MNSVPNFQNISTEFPQTSPQLYPHKSANSPQARRIEGLWSDLRDEQLALFAAQTETPAQPVFIKPRGKTYHGRPAYFFTLHCGYGYGQFGGLYSRTECDRILDLLRHKPGPISPIEFGRAAEVAIAESNQALREVAA